MFVKNPIGKGVHDVRTMRLTSGVTPADLLMASMVASRCSPHSILVIKVRDSSSVKENIIIIDNMFTVLKVRLQLSSTQNNIRNVPSQ